MARLVPQAKLNVALLTGALAFSTADPLALNKAQANVAYADDQQAFEEQQKQALEAKKERLKKL